VVIQGGWPGRVTRPDMCGSYTGQIPGRAGRLGTDGG
jgi:hypothetical protein